MCTRWFAKVLYGAMVLLWVLVILCVTSKPAYGYVDPGSGLLLLQVLGSTFAGAAFLIRRRICQWLHIGVYSEKAGSERDRD